MLTQRSAVVSLVVTLSCAVFSHLIASLVALALQVRGAYIAAKRIKSKEVWDEIVENKKLANKMASISVILVVFAVGLGAPVLWLSVDAEVDRFRYDSDMTAKVNISSRSDRVSTFVPIGQQCMGLEACNPLYAPMADVILVDMDLAASGAQLAINSSDKSVRGSLTLDSYVDFDIGLTEAARTIACGTAEVKVFDGVANLTSAANFELGPETVNIGDCSINNLGGGKSTVSSETYTMGLVVGDTCNAILASDGVAVAIEGTGGNQVPVSACNPANMMLYVVNNTQMGTTVVGRAIVDGVYKYAACAGDISNVTFCSIIKNIVYPNVSESLANDLSSIRNYNYEYWNICTNQTLDVIYQDQTYATMSSGGPPIVLKDRMFMSVYANELESCNKLSALSDNYAQLVTQGKTRVSLIGASVTYNLNDAIIICAAVAFVLDIVINIIVSRRFSKYVKILDDEARERNKPFEKDLPVIQDAHV